MDYEWLYKLWEQAYFYIPLILSFLAAIGVPSAVQLIKIFSVNRKNAIRFTKIEEYINANNGKETDKHDTELNLIDCQIKEATALMNLSYNPNIKKVYQDKINDLNECKDKLTTFKLEEVHTSNKKIKVKVKKIWLRKYGMLSASSLNSCGNVLNGFLNGVLRTYLVS